MSINFEHGDLDDDVNFITLKEILEETDIELLEDYLNIFEEEELYESCAKIRDRIKELNEK